MQNKKAFTLVELIVVITILAILWTIAFMSFDWYSRDARDSVRTSDIWNIKTSLELFQLNAWKYPIPDNWNIVSYSWDTLWTQWVLWENVLKNLSRNLNELPKDPLNDQKYIYSKANNNLEYEILWLYEWSDLVLNTTFWEWNAADIKMLPKISWTYNWVFIKTANYIVPTPSIVNAEVIDSDIELNSLNIKSQVVSWFDNVPSLWWVISSTGWLTGLNLSVYEWSVNSKTSDSEKEIVINTIKNAYSGSELSNDWKISNILSVDSQEEIINIFDLIVLNNSSSTSSDSWDSIVTINTNNCVNSWDTFLASSTYQWCDSQDIVVCSWTWTWYIVSSCNVWSSMAWTWPSNYWEIFQWWEDITWTDASVENCFWNRDTQSCDWSAVGLSTWVADNISWWVDRWYDWSQTDNRWPCANWYHVPSKTDWEWVDTLLWSLISDALNLANTNVYKLNAFNVSYLDNGYYWSSTAAADAYNTYAYDLVNWISTNDRGSILSVRCFKN